MVKFIHKNRINKEPKTKVLVIYYSFSDFVLGFLLIVLVGFFIYSYIVSSLRPIPSTQVQLPMDTARTMPVGMPK
jgi:hypothetical protein